ncbi:Uu.00g145470.m01.CDS01 [Anthostomella pinea]|uniref:Uu.00g145470.m01.CDS01 n=1 Tax=Anthostomella pinea TaxID=933095 RepID=A0AAI8VR08_9PEZI|nr:Uu.00g145470.m01.CDS01 [Anthostomella pinea]
MELTRFLAFLAVALPVVYGAPTQTATNLGPKVLEAMKRDLGLESDQAYARVARELSAVEIIEQIKTAAGNSFAGAWVTENGAITNVAITDAAMAGQVTAAGATPVIVSNSLSKLEEAKLALDNTNIDQPTTLSTGEEAATGIAAYYVDVEANKLVIEALAGSTDHAAALAAQVGLTESEFEVKTVDALNTPFLQGGDAYYIARSARCSVGFSVTTGFVSAGHCGTAGSSVSTTLTGTAIGTFSASVFPGSADMSYIRTTSGTNQGSINGYNSADQDVAGSTAAAVGAAICRSGSTTGVHCGTVRSLGATVTYAEGRVTGLTQTNVCAEPGDSGGSFYSGAQAQGVTSGGSGDCTAGGITYFQPVNEILSTYGLTLVT